MTKKKRTDHATSNDGTFDSPFASLASLRDSVAPSPPPKSAEQQAASTTTSPFAFSNVVLRREKAGRKGKTVVKLENTGLSSSDLATLATALKKKLGCAATVEGEAVVVLGDLEDRIEAVLLKEGVSKITRGSARR